MRIRTFRVPFARLVGEDATELEFGPEDYLVVRPIFGLPAAQVAELSNRMTSLGVDDKDGLTDDEKAARATADAQEADALLLDLMGSAIVEWHLTGPEGEDIPRPQTGDEVRKLPAGLAGAFFSFIATYRGDVENPTKRA